jgi:hypothetical protein
MNFFLESNRGHWKVSPNCQKQLTDAHQCSVVPILLPIERVCGTGYYDKLEGD